MVADIEQLGFDDRLAGMIEREAEHRNHKRYARPSSPGTAANSLDRHPGRQICRADTRSSPGPQSTKLAAGDWIRQAINPIVEGLTGIAKAASYA